MDVSIGKKTKNHHSVLLISNTTKLDKALATFVEQTLKLEKKVPYKVGGLPQIHGKDIHYTLIAHIQDIKNIEDYIEDLVAELVAGIKKLDADFFIDLDASGLQKNDAILFAELVMTALYSFDRYKKVTTKKHTLTIQSKHIDPKKFTALRDTFTLTKDLINDPSHSVHPVTFEKAIRKIFAKTKNTKITIFDDKELVKKGMMGIYNVGKGSEHGPRLVLVEYKGINKKGYDIGLVGKGVCFDSGGYNIKPTGSMEDMKIDMAGGATALGILHYAVQNKLKKNIILAIPMVENLVSHNAYKPGEIITMYNGKTVEIGNTDAEGRLILADTLSYVEEKYKPTHVFDFATLTGAQLVATGNHISAIIGRNSELNQKLQKRSFELKDRVRELPFFKPYFKTYKSEIADMNNISTAGRSGPGTITAGLFLSQFISMQNWVHFDIAGPAYKSSDPLTGHGATGCVIRLVVDFLENN